MIPANMLRIGISIENSCNTTNYTIHIPVREASRDGFTRYDFKSRCIRMAYTSDIKFKERDPELAEVEEYFLNYAAFVALTTDRRVPYIYSDRVDTPMEAMILAYGPRVVRNFIKKWYKEYPMEFQDIFYVSNRMRLMELFYATWEAIINKSEAYEDKIHLTILYSKEIMTPYSNKTYRYCLRKLEHNERMTMLDKIKRFFDLNA